MPKYFRFSPNKAVEIELAISFTRLRYRVYKAFHLDKNTGKPIIRDGTVPRVRNNDIRINFRAGSHYYDYLDTTTELSPITRYLIDNGYISLERITGKI